MGEAGGFRATGKRKQRAESRKQEKLTEFGRRG
jgi:hypothetical protein